MIDLRTVRGFEPGDEVGIRAVMEASLAVDAIPGFTRSHIDRALFRLPAYPGGTVVALEDGRIVGYCTPRQDDLTVLPERRRRGHGRALVAAAAEVERLQGRDHLTLYVPAHLEASRQFATALGFAYVSSLWQFRLDAAVGVPEAVFPPGFVVRAFDPARDGDIEAWVAFMQASFEGHPTALAWNVEITRHVHAAPDFDPSAILIVSRADDAGRRVAFALLELHRSATDVPPPGEVVLLGVLPAWRRRGLGRELLRWGVTELRRRGARPIELSVEAANDQATTLYRAHGFVPAIEWPHWRRPTR